MEKLKENLRNKLKNKNYAWDIYIENNIKNEAKVNEGKVDSLRSADSYGGALRIFKEGKAGFAYFAGETDAEKIIEKAEKHILIEGYGDYTPGNFQQAAKINMCDNDFSSITLEDVKNKAFELEKAVSGYGGKIKYARDTTAASNHIRVSYSNSRGAENDFEKTYSFAYTSAVASDGRSEEVCDGMDGSVYFKKLDCTALGKSAAERAIKLIGGKSVKSGSYDICLPPHTAVELLSVVSQLFLSQNIRKGKSLLKDFKEGDKIGAEILEIRDDALLDRSAGSFPVDAEGYTGENKSLVKGGLLSTFLYDSINASLMGKKSTGNSVKQGIKSFPEPGISNFYIANGNINKEKAMNNFSGIMADALMGMHTANPVSGNFSLGLSGWLYEKGRIVQPVKEALLSGNIKTMLENMEIICDDLKFYFNLGSPTVIIKDMVVAGKE